ncbi:MAG: NAD-dependent epimerase/dehydratase family protein, partial [Rariglobus sp.]
MKMILAGGSGQVGQMLQRAWTRAGHECVVLTRRPMKNATTRSVHWDGQTLGAWTNEIETADVVVNLAGRSVNCRYTEANLEQMMRSRVESTRVIGLAIQQARRPPRLWLQAGTATIYAHRHDAPNDEHSGVIGGAEPGVPALWKRSVDIALAWENEQARSLTPHTRKVVLRSAMIMSPDRGGVFSAFATLCSLGMGPQGNGRQFVSWIHERDFVAALDFIIGNESLAGAINLCSPAPLPNRDFVAAI